MRAFRNRVGELRRFGETVLLFAMASFGTGYGTSALAEPKTHTIVMEAMRFSPQMLEVEPGDTVVWVNKDAFPHNAVATGKGFQSPDIAPDGAWKFKAMKKGTFPYICTLHPTMKAVLTVR